MAIPASRASILALVLAMHLAMLLLARLSIVVERPTGEATTLVPVWLRPAKAGRVVGHFGPRGRVNATGERAAAPAVGVMPARSTEQQVAAGEPQRKAIDWDHDLQLAIGHVLAGGVRTKSGNIKDGSGRQPDAPAAIAREAPFPWSDEPHFLVRKNRIGNVSVSRAGLMIHLGKDRCIIVDLVAFGCRIGPEAQANGALFSDMRAHLDARIGDPLP